MHRAERTWRTQTHLECHIFIDNGCWIDEGKLPVQVKEWTEKAQRSDLQILQSKQMWKSRLSPSSSVRKQQWSWWQFTVLGGMWQCDQGKQPATTSTSMVGVGSRPWYRTLWSWAELWHINLVTNRNLTGGIRTITLHQLVTWESGLCVLHVLKTKKQIYIYLGNPNSAPKKPEFCDIKEITQVQLISQICTI